MKLHDESTLPGLLIIALVTAFFFSAAVLGWDVDRIFHFVWSIPVALILFAAPVALLLLFIAFLAGSK
ncbi:MAG: hypothetical protein LBS49_14965 [Candidatus Accumulibacter sp.]|jgi:hypothetical protein|nr:hypothetical protein [Accumulibacter sp.]